MKNDAERLARLAAAHRDLARSREAKLLHCEREIASLASAMDGMRGAVDAAAASGLPFTEAGLRRILEAERQLARLRSQAATLRSELLAARAREEIFAEASRKVRTARERKAEEESALETAMAMRKTASRKPGVLN